jgi:hypothetical protein
LILLRLLHCLLAYSDRHAKQLHPNRLLHNRNTIGNRRPIRLTAKKDFAGERGVLRSPRGGRQNG